MGYLSGVLINKRCLVISMVVGSIVMILVYYIYGVILEENFLSPLVSIIGDGISSVLTIIIVMGIKPLTDKVFKK